MLLSKKQTIRILEDLLRNGSPISEPIGKVIVNGPDHTTVVFPKSVWEVGHDWEYVESAITAVVRALNGLPRRWKYMVYIGGTTVINLSVFDIDKDRFIEWIKRRGASYTDSATYYKYHETNGGFWSHDIEAKIDENVTISCYYSEKD